jgi:flagellar basal-body rod protein FlgF
MSWEIYSGVSGATAAWSQMDVISHNLANVSTDGFKARSVTFAVAAGTEGKGPLASGYVEPRPMRADMRDGALDKTDRELDIALQGEGFFTLEKPNGEVMLSRGGRFHTDEEGFVVSVDGWRLRGSGGPIQIPIGERLIVTQDGWLRTNQGMEMGTLEILSGPAEPIGSTYWKATGPMEDVVLAQIGQDPEVAPRVRIHQGHLERSNVDPLKVMVDLIEAARYFEAYQNVMKSSDEADARLMRAGRIG